MLHFNEEIRRSVTLLRSHSVLIEDGLTEKEVAYGEERFDFQFPPDLREFLQIALPIGQGFPNWRSGDEATLRGRLDWPFEGMAFDIEHNAFWLDEWGARPGGLSEAIAVARRHVGMAPKLIPVFSHRYLPEDPTIAGNPIFSVHQTDIIYYGKNLWDYFEQEFGPHGEGWYAGERYAALTSEEYHAFHRPIRFWSSLVS